MPKLKRLSVKQTKFVNNMVRTGNQTQSALDAYNTKSLGTAKTVANRNMNNPMVVEEIDRVLKKNNITLEATTSRLRDIAEWAPDKVSSDTVLKANIELVKLLKGYPNLTKKIESRTTKLSLTLKDYKELLDLNRLKQQEITEIVDGY